MNNTFEQYKGIPVQHIPVLNASQSIEPKQFDKLMESLLTEEGTFVIDNGANTFSPLLAYMIENDVISFLIENNKKVYIHCIVGGGHNLKDTANGFNSVARDIQDAPVVLWLNEHFGSMKTSEGKEFTETKAFKDNKSRLHGVVVLQARNHQTYGDDIKKMNAQRLTVEEVMQSPDFGLMEKQRIRNVAKDVFSQLEKIEF